MGAGVLSGLQLPSSHLKQHMLTKVTVASSPGASKWKDKALSMSSFSSHPRRSRSVFSNQACPYLEGPPGFTHGGSLAAMMDETFSKTAFLAGEGLFTLSFNIRFKNLIPRSSLVVMDIEVEKIEDQKLYMSCLVHSRDQQTVYTKSSGVFLQLQLEEESPQ
ncbi:hypothetical protein H8959_017704 [Pygathrix nigripes]